MINVDKRLSARSKFITEGNYRINKMKAVEEGINATLGRRICVEVDAQGLVPILTKQEQPPLVLTMLVMYFGIRIFSTSIYYPCF